MTVLALVVAGVALILAVVLATQVVGLRRRWAAVPRDSNVFEILRQLDDDLAAAEVTLADLVPRLESIEKRLPLAISRTAVTNYDAFGDISGNQSRSIALLDEDGNGLVLSILVGRRETLFFTKQVRRGSGSEMLSPEEAGAVRLAMAQ